MLRTTDGTVYGWTVGGKIYLNRDAMNPEAPLHEYTHLWDDMVREQNPELWSRGKELLKETPLWEEVMNDPAYADIRGDEDAVASEVHSRLTGRDGERLLKDMIENAKKDGPLETARVVTMVERIRQWLRDMFKGLKSTLGKWSKRDLRNLTAEDFAHMTLRDLAEGMDPRSGERKMARGREDFEAKRERAARERGIVMPGLNEASVRVVEVPRHDFGGDKPISQARKWAKENIAGEHTLTDSKGEEVQYAISGRSIDKYLSSSAIEKSDNPGVHLSVLKKLPEVISESIEAEVHPDYKKGPDGKRSVENGYNEGKLIHRFYGAVGLDGKEYRVKTTIVESRKPEDLLNPHSFEVTEIELLPEDNNSITLEPTAPDYQGQVAYRTAKLLQGVEKSYDSGKKLLEESRTEEQKERTEEQKGQAATDRANGANGADRPVEDNSDKASVEAKRGRIEKLRESEPIVITDEDIPSGIDLTERRAVQKYLLENVRGAYKNTDTGENLHVLRQGIEEVTHHGMTDQAHVKSLFAIPKMLRGAIFIEERANAKDKWKTQARMTPGARLI